ncbi:MAG: hypothetical protein LQ342_000445 [Letrouitia transgressa]|nr:MAG: hypothetical protein LQ342_000445 [Letrouitia transgressa]
MVEFRVNGTKQDYAMKLGEGGEAFFVFETSDQIPESLQTSPVLSPTASPHNVIQHPTSAPSLQEPEYLDISTDVSRGTSSELAIGGLKVSERPIAQRTPTMSDGQLSSKDTAKKIARPLTPGPEFLNPLEGVVHKPYWHDTAGLSPGIFKRSASEELLALPSIAPQFKSQNLAPTHSQWASTDSVLPSPPGSPRTHGSNSPPLVPIGQAIDRANTLSKRLSDLNFPTQVNNFGDIMLDMTGYKGNEGDALRAEAVARKILAEELEGNYDVGALIDADEHGNLWIYSSEQAKDAATQRINLPGLAPSTIISSAASDPGYQSDDEQQKSYPRARVKHHRTLSDASPTEVIASPQTPQVDVSISGDPNRNYAKTLRLTSDQLKSLNLRPGANTMSFSVNRSTCQAYMYFWTFDVPIVISDIDGTITKSDALGHVLNMIGRDWTHIGVAKLYTDIVANGYNILYLTSRSVGQADTTRAYLNGVSQEGFQLPQGPVIMSPDRTMAALRREIYLRKPEVFKMSCLRDILTLFNQKNTPFYAGFGNRLTDALSYRSINIPSTRIFTINSNAEVSLDMLSLNKYKNSYVTMRELVDHFFPPTGLLLTRGAEEFTDFNYWRDTPPELEDFTDSDNGSEAEKDIKRAQWSIRSEDEGSEGLDDLETNEELGDSYISPGSVEENGDLADSILESIEGGQPLAGAILLKEDQSTPSLSLAELKIPTD